MGAAKKNLTTQRPNVFEYHDYREFLNDLLAYLKASRFNLSKRDVAKSSGVASGYLPMVLNRKRNLSVKAVDKFKKALRLNDQEISYLKLLLTLSDSNDQDERLKAVKRMQTFKEYKRNNAKELEVYKYLTHWEYVAIREMSALSDFVLDAKWIQKRLKKHLPLSQIEQAIDFLIKNEFIKLDENNNIVKPDRSLECLSGVFRLSLGGYYKQMLGLGAELFEQTPKEDRNFLSHTVAVTPEKADKIKAILDQALAEVLEITKEADPQAKEVYHVGLLAFPLTESGEKKEQGE
ncbi:MAG: TIGR02147 family protein [Bdellovibrionales bacterium]